MPCRRFGDDASGTWGFVCGPGARAKRCAYCGDAATRLCDFAVDRKRGKGTCDAPLCDRCTTRIAGDGDLCRAHVPLWNARLGHAPKPGPEAA